MAKKAYVGISDTARNVKNIYVGVNGVARKVVKGYVGVNGVARQFWGDGTPSVLSNWNLWCSDEWLYINDDIGFEVHKTNPIIAYYGFVHLSGQEYAPIFMSPDADATEFTYTDTDSGTSTTYTYSGTLTDVNNIIWYYNIQPNAVMTFSSSYYEIPNVSVNTAPQTMLDMIYTIPFHEDYQVGETYIATAYSSIDSALRTVVGVFLFNNISLYDSDLRYNNLSNNANTIIRTVGNYDNHLAMCRVQLGSGYIVVEVDSKNINPSVEITEVQTSEFGNFYATDASISNATREYAQVAANNIYYRSGDLLSIRLNMGFFPPQSTTSYILFNAGIEV